MTVFEYIVGIHTIVLGLATAYLLTTLADLIKHRDSVTHYWVYTSWCVLMQFLMVAWWYGLWRLLSDEAVVSYLDFLEVFAFTVSLFMAARMLTTDIEESHVDLKQHFYKIRIPFFSFLTLPYVIAFSAGWLFTMDTTIGDWISAAVQLVVPIVGLASSNEKLQKILVFAYGVPFLVIELQQYAVGMG